MAAEFSPGNGAEATCVVVSPAGAAAAASARRLPGRYPEAGYLRAQGRRPGEAVARRLSAGLTGNYFK